jgi:hypothetical protein
MLVVGRIDARHRRVRHRDQCRDRNVGIDVGGGRIGRQVEHVVDRLDLVGRGLHRNDVVHAGLRIEEVGRADQRAAGERGQHVVGDVALRHTEPRGALAINVDLDGREIQDL